MSNKSTILGACVFIRSFPLPHQQVKMVVSPFVDGPENRYEQILSGAEKLWMILHNERIDDPAFLLSVASHPILARNSITT